MGKIPTTFGHFKSPFHGLIHNKKFNASIPKDIPSLPSLSIVLNLPKNFLSGPLAPKIALKGVETIRAWRNYSWQEMFFPVLF